jgi:hypothetical protein
VTRAVKDHYSMKFQEVAALLPDFYF